MKALVAAIVGIIVISVYVSVLASANQTAIGTQAMTILNVVPVFVGLAILGVIVALVYGAFKGGGSAGI